MPSNRALAAGLSLAVAAAASFPFVYTRFFAGSKNLTLSDAPLQGQNVMRGAYINTGSKDVGRDPDWDPATNSWRGRKTVRAATAEVASAKASGASASASASGAPSQ